MSSLKAHHHRQVRQQLLLLALGLVLSQTVTCLQQAAVLAPLPPPAPDSLAHLVGNSASAQLASDFLAFERQREPHRQAAAVFGRSSFDTGSAASSKQARQQKPGAIHHQLFTLKPHYSSSLNGSFRLDQYHTLEEVYGFLDSLQSRYPRRVNVFEIGRTSENRPIKALEITNNASDSDFVWLDATTHAREWITTSTIVYIIDQLIAGSGNTHGFDPLSRKNFIIIPVVNPDGYAFTWTHNRMWRKNRSRQSSARFAVDQKCIGADLNRNFDIAFGGEGSSSDPCSHIYSGAYPFSEPEIRALGDLLWLLRDRIKFYLTIHSYNQLWACPYAHTTEPSASLQEHMRVLQTIQRAVYLTEGVQYEIGPLSTSLYVGSGFGIDFAYEKCGIEHSYLVELRDKGARGFELPPEEIMPTGRETLAGLRAGLRAVFGS